jgi:hypothetical protein
VLFRRRALGEQSGAEQRVGARVRKSRQKEAAGAADAGLMQIEWSEAEVLMLAGVGTEAEKEVREREKPASKIESIVFLSCDPLSGMRRSSVRFDRFIFHPCLIRNPVDFPGFAPILRE